jgi:DNA-binding MarR family transcriptional regulator
MATPKRNVRLETHKSDTKKELVRSEVDDMIPLPVGTPVSLDNLPELLGYNLRRAQIEMWRDFTQNVGDGEIRPGLYSLILLVGANPGIAQIELANYLGVDKASIVALIDRLEDSGWVLRKRSSEDRRRHGIFLTPSGIKKLAQLKHEVTAHDKKFTGRFTADEYATLLEFLQRVRR